MIDEADVAEDMSIFAKCPECGRMTRLSRSRKTRCPKCQTWFMHSDPARCKVCGEKTHGSQLRNAVRVRCLSDETQKTASMSRPRGRKFKRWPREQENR